MRTAEQIHTEIMGRVRVDAAGCWLWQGGLNPDGYGQATIDQKRLLIHRAMYEARRGAIPAGMQIDHLCRVRHCCNPDHLEAVTPRENTLRGEGRAAKHAVATECWSGHEFTPENTYQRPTGGRACRTCRRAADRRWREKSRANG